MKANDIVVLFRLLEQVLFCGMTAAGKARMLDNMIKLKPMFREYHDAMEIAKEKYRFAGFDEDAEKMELDRLARDTKTEDGKLSAREKYEIGKRFEKYQKEVSVIEKERLEMEYPVELAKIDKEDMEALFEANERYLNGQQLLMLKEYFSIKPENHDRANRRKSKANNSR
jgi:hypothetical protein